MAGTIPNRDRHPSIDMPARPSRINYGYHPVAGGIHQVGLGFDVNTPHQSHQVGGLPIGYHWRSQEFRRHCVGGLRPPVSQEALAQKDLNWSEVKSWLYSEAFTGCTKIILRCRYCLSEMHNVRACPSNPDTGILDLFYRTSGPLTHLAKDICRNYNDGRCHYDRCKYQHICH